MLEAFKKKFLLTDEGEFSRNVSDRYCLHAVKRNITNEAYCVYARVGTWDSESDTDNYQLIAVAANDDSVIRFFNNGTLHKMFTPKEQAKLREMSGGTLLSFEQVYRDFIAALGRNPGNAQLQPLPGSVEQKEEDYYATGMVEYALMPKDVPFNENLRYAMKNLGKISRIDGFFWCFYEGDGWYREVTLRWLASVVAPAYPNYDLKREKDLYIATLMRMAEEAKADKSNPLNKYIGMKNADKGHDVVTIDFSCTDDSIASLKVHAKAFEDGWVERRINAPVVDFKECYAGDLMTLMAVTPKLTSVIFDDAHEGEQWIDRNDILAIRDEKGNILWSA